MVVANSVQGTSILSNTARAGILFQTPLSRTDWGNDDVGRNAMVKGVEDYIETRFETVNAARCQELAHAWGITLEFPRIFLAWSWFQMTDSYDDYRNSLRGKDCKKEYCEQMSDQLLYCSECGHRPILYNVIRDEASMRRHLSDHKRENEDQVEEIKEIKRKLLSKLERGLLQPLEVGYSNKNA